MNQFPQEFYNPLAIALNGAQLQDFVNELLAKYNGLEIDGFRWNDDLLQDFTYQQVQRDLKMEVMASYVDLDSPAIPVGSEGDVIGTGSIPRMKSVEYYNEAKLRKLRQMEDRRSVSRTELINTAGANIGEILMKLVMRHTNSLKYQRHQVVSTGKFTLTDTNNPNGIQNVTFSSHVPLGNYKTLSGENRWWTDAAKSTEGKNADPIGDLKKMAQDIKRKSVRGHLEINDLFLDDLLGHSKVISAVAANLYPNAGAEAWAIAAAKQLKREGMISIIEGIIGLQFKAWDSQVSVEKYNKTTKKLERPTFDAFESDVVVFVPEGGLGEILTVEPILLEGGEYAFYYGRKLAITIGKNYEKKCMSYNSEMTSLVVPDVPQYMFYLHPCKVG